MTIKPATGGARVIADTEFHLAIVGDFSGRDHDFEQPGPLHVSPNEWDALFEQIAPTATVTVDLPRVDDLHLELGFRSLADFRPKQLQQRVGILVALSALLNGIEQASADTPLDVAGLLSEYPDLETLRSMAADSEEEQAIDLLNMVDIGEDDGCNLPLTKKLFSAKAYDGTASDKLIREVHGVRNEITEQIATDKEVNRIAGLWRGLKLFLPHLRRQKGCPAVHLTLIDCPKDQICDAVFLTFIKPESGNPHPLDLLICPEPLATSDDDRHIVYHLGRMAASLSAPFLLESAPALFGCRTWQLLKHVPDISGKLSGPGHIKWRKLRTEPGAHWQFLCANPFHVREEPGEDEDAEPTAPACFLPALMMAGKLHDGLWPSEMIGAWSRIEAPGRPLTTLREPQLEDLAFEGFVPVAANEHATHLELAGITCLAEIQIPPRDQANPANILPYTLPYAFYSGCCSRFIAGYEGEDLASALVDYTAVKKEDDVAHEEDEGKRMFRIKAPFTVLGVHPDLVLVL